MPDYLQKQLVPLQFGGGINTKADPKQLQAGQLLTLQNGQFSKEGQINKRYGYDLLGRTIEGGSGSTISAGASLAIYNDELLLFDGTGLYSYLPATGNWAYRGIAQSIVTQDKDIIRTSAAQQLNPDMNYASGIEVYAWEDSRSGVRYSVLDNSSKAFPVSDSSVNNSGHQPKVIAFNGKLYIFYTNGTTTLSYQQIDPASPTAIGAKVDIATDGYNGTNGFPYDVAVIGTRMFVGYLSSSTASGAIQLFYLDTSLTKSSVTVVDNTAGHAISAGVHGAVTVAADSSNNVWIAWCYTNNMRAAAYSNSLVSVLASKQIDSTSFTWDAICAIESPTAGTMLVFAQSPVTSGAFTFEQTQYKTVDTSGLVGGGNTILKVGLASKPWKYNGNIYINLAYDSTLQATDFTYLVAVGTTLLSPPVIVAKETPSVGGGLITNGMVAETVNIATGQYKFANLQSGKLLSEANTLFSLLGVNSTNLVFNQSNEFLNTTQQNTLMIVGGILQAYDGVSCTELGFNLYPEGVTATAGGADGSLSVGTYQYIVQWEWTDNNGQIYRSAPSTPVSVTVSANQHVVIAASYLAATSKFTFTTGVQRAPARPAISIVIYRTLVNGDGTLFYRCSSTLAPTLNVVTSNSAFSFTDTASDASIAANELNYTTGGVLANIAPPANSLIATYNGRTFLGGLSDKNLIWYSQAAVDNSNSSTIPPQFCQELITSVDRRGGNITAFGVLNGGLIIFKDSEIFAMAGNGPNATGNDNDFGDPSLITSDVGCNNANSVVLMPLGLMFQSPKGIYLLDQSLNVSYIGAPVEAYNDGYTITSAVLHNAQNQVIFTTNNNVALVYDYYFKQWSVWTNHNAVSAVIWNDTYCWLSADGYVHKQNTSKFTEGDGSAILLSFTTPNLQFAGIQGYQRVFRAFILGTYKGAHTLNIQVAYDFSDTYTQSASITAGSNYDYRVDFSTQKCTSIRLNVADSQSSNFNEGYAISSIVFEVGVLPGGNRLPATSTYGAK